MTPRPTVSRFLFWLVASGALGASGSAWAQITNAAAPLVAPSLPNPAAAFIRILGALCLVIGLFFGGVWLYKNWQRLAAQRGQSPKLNILETRSLGGRHAIFVVGYEQERLLIASSPAGVTLLTHLPSAEVGEVAPPENNPAPPSFAQALAQVLKGK